MLINQLSNNKNNQNQINKLILSLIIMNSLHNQFIKILIFKNWVKVKVNRQKHKINLYMNKQLKIKVLFKSQNKNFIITTNKMNQYKLPNKTNICSPTNKNLKVKVKHKK